jgi:hypothetical protein
MYQAVKQTDDPATAAAVRASLNGVPSTTSSAPAGLGGPSGLPSVSERTTAIIDQNSPLMQRAATKGLQGANRRGLGNSSMAVQASQTAVLDAATPIASQEASLSQQDNLALRELGQRERDNLANAITGMNSTQMSALADTLNNPDIPAATRAAMQQAIQAQTMTGMNYLQNLYGVSVSGATPATNAASTLPPASVAPASTRGLGGSLR